MTPQLLKPAVARDLNALLAPIQEAFQSSKEFQQVAEKAYPPPPKKEKKVKNKGSRHPGNKEQAENKEQELPIRPNGDVSIPN